MVLMVHEFHAQVPAALQIAVDPVDPGVTAVEVDHRQVAIAEPRHAGAGRQPRTAARHKTGNRLGARTIENGILCRVNVAFFDPRRARVEHTKQAGNRRPPPVRAPNGFDPVEPVAPLPVEPEPNAGQQRCRQQCLRHRHHSRLYKCLFVFSIQVSYAFWEFLGSVVDGWFGRAA